MMDSALVKWRRSHSFWCDPREEGVYYDHFSEYWNVFNISQRRAKCNLHCAGFTNRGEKQDERKARLEYALRNLRVLQG